MEAAGISNDTLKLIISNDPVKLMVFAGTSNFDFLLGNLRPVGSCLFSIISRAAVAQLKRWWRMARKAKVTYYYYWLSK